MLAGWIPKAPRTSLSQKYGFELTKYPALGKGTLALRPWGHMRKRGDVLRCQASFGSHPTSLEKKVKPTLHPL